MLAVPPNQMEMGLNNKSPDTTFLAAYSKSEHGVVLLKIEETPSFLRLIYEITYFMAMMHPMAGIRSKLINFTPG